MEVKYSLYRNEVWEWYWDSWLDSGLKWIHLYIFFMISLSFLFFDYSNDAISAHTLMKIGASFLFVFTFMILFPQLMYKPQERTLTISDNGIHTTIAEYDKSLNWNEVLSVENSDGYIKIVGKNNNAMLVPERAFPSLDDMLHFYQYASLLLNGVKKV